MEAYRDHMRRCIALARRAEGRTAPNPMVGALILRDGQVVAEGWHEGPGLAHAEVDALRRLEGSAAGTTLVVNLEPCCHHGRTPPCSDALIDAGVARVVVGMVDPNPRVGGKGVRQLRDAGVEVVLGVEEARSWQLNRDFVERVQALVDSGELDPEGFAPGAYEPEPEAGSPTRFVVISAPRTGSDELCSLLDSHPEILCHHELCNVDGVRYALSQRDTGFCLGTTEARDADPVGFVHRAWREHQGARAVGFALARRHPEFVFRDVIADPGVRKIVLRRRNRLETFVSELLARKERRWTHDGASPCELTKIKIEVELELDDLRAYAEQQDAFYDRVTRALEARGQAFIEVDYEDLLEAKTQARILAELGFNAAALEGLRGTTPKRKPDALEESIANYDQLARQLAGTEFEAELDPRTPRLAPSPARGRPENPGELETRRARRGQMLATVAPDASGDKGR
ncbi:Riboflavin biosynthesis protein RibD [Enhygromyxa salina]|uniref:diaminohydroxyphosphoribosylaminopyrimidine deaminase n=1 Tax=Enhygromyxa salina TaxID=215803 RepID=A0A2S9XES3_9BACT|nr:bifunctional diaminohydroxyphosphoribosylaminopyrimidine deaminase/5-amino-6-(5-phosphoribosylamino)uracil reductase RibD [Enhygromyxa salina]PRP91171.1 Riboflavin biosynthesis protein RibD [Enhygromyxa salina]